MNDTKHSKRHPLSIECKKSEHDYNFFEIIDRLILEIYIFILQFVKTTWLVFRHPLIFHEQIDDLCDRKRIASPFLYLASSIIISGFLEFGNLGRSFGVIFENRLHKISKIESFLLAIPETILVLSFAMAFSWIVRKHNDSERIIPSYYICYLYGYFSVISASFMVLVLSLNLNIHSIENCSINEYIAIVIISAAYVLYAYSMWLFPINAFFKKKCKYVQITAFFWSIYVCNIDNAST